MKMKKLVAGVMAAAMMVPYSMSAAAPVQAMDGNMGQSIKVKRQNLEPVLNVTFDGKDASDSSGRGNDGAIVGAAKFVDGVEGKAIRLVNPDGVAAAGVEGEQYINFGQPDDLKFGKEDFTISFCYKSDGNDPEEVSVVGNKDWSTGNNDGLVIADFRNGMALNFATGGQGRIETGRWTEATDSTWHYVTGTFDRDDDMVLYIDGREVDRRDLTPQEGGNIDVADFVIGADGYHHYSVKDSVIDEFQVYKSALDKGQVESLSAQYVLKGKIADCEEELASSTQTQEKKDAFVKAIEKARQDGEGVDDIAKIEEIVETLEAAYEVFIEEDYVENEPVLKLTFDNEDATDSSGRGNDGTIIGDVKFTEGVKGKAVHLVNSADVAATGNEAEQCIDFGQARDLQFGKKDFSIMFWYKSNGDDPEEVSVVGNKDWSTGSNDGFVIADFRNGMALNFATGGEGRIETGRWTEATDNTWHHVAGTFDRDGEMIFYIDGEKIDSKDLTPQQGNSINVANFVIGADGYRHYAVKDSYIDEFEVYRGIIPAEKLKEMNAPYVLKRQIDKYQQQLDASDKSDEKKAEFQAVLDKVKKESEGVTDVQKLDELRQELVDAFNVFFTPEKGIVEFEALSDVHIRNNDMEDDNAVHLIHAYETIGKLFPDSLGIMNGGDISDSGNEDQFEGYYNIIDNYTPEGMTTLSAIGNHDVRWKSGWDEIYERYMRYNQKYMGDTDGKVYYDKWIGGYHFIILNTEWDTKDRAYISNEQIEWLDKKMAEGAEEGKPIFIFFHQAMRDTYFNSNDWSIGVQDYAVKEVLRKYPQTVMFTGHIHNGLDSCTVIDTDYGAMVDMPSFYYNDTGQSRGEIGYHVTVYEDKVLLSMYDYKNNVWMPEYDYVIDMDPKKDLPGKVLDVSFDDGTAKDESGHGNDGTINGNVEFVDGVEGKALHITNSEETAGKAVRAEQYIDFGDAEDLKFGEDDFTIMFWAKGDAFDWGDYAVVSNKNWDTGANQGFAIGTFSSDRYGFGLNFTGKDQERADTDRVKKALDGGWHHIAATFDRDGQMVLYVDGREADSADISGQQGSSIDTGLGFVLGADGNFQNGSKDIYIDEFKVYRKVIGAAEMETVYNPYHVETDETTAVVTWDDIVREENTEPAYIAINGKKYADIPKDADSITIEGLTPGTFYNAIVVNHEKQYSNNYQDAFTIDFTTKAKEPVKPVSTDVLEYTLELAENADTTGVVVSVVERFEELKIQGQDILQRAKQGDESVTQEMIDAAWQELVKVMQYFSFKQGDKAELEKVVAFAEDMNENLSQYLEEGKAAFTKALAKAKTVLEDGDAMQEEVDSAWQELMSAMAGLQRIPDKSALEELLNKAAELYEDDYEAGSYAVFTTAYAKAKSVYEDETATSVEVKDAEKELKDAIAKLTPVVSEKEEQKVVLVSGEKGNGENSAEKTAPVKSVKTGDVTDVMAVIVCMIIAGGAICVSAGLLKKRKNR